MSSSSHSLIVAAFDFGTTYSGYAFSFKDSPNDVKTNKTWTAGAGKLISLKTPTSVLLNQSGEFDSFGFDAEDKYSSLAEDGKHHGWRLFRRFKMILHNQKIISDSTTVEDLEGKTFPAKLICSMCIRYLKTHLLEALDPSTNGIRETDIRYIITVPAIWGIAAKQFMRESAIEAGIDSNRLKLALEPEAAAVCCDALSHTLAGQKFMVVDTGGGTADISVHEKQTDGSLKNIASPSGGPWGGMYVDANFIALIEVIFGEDALAALQAEDMYEYFDLVRDFELKKRKFNVDSKSETTFKIPAKLKEQAEKHFKQSLSDRLASLNYGERVFTRGKDKLAVHSSIMREFFAVPVSEMVQHIIKVLGDGRMRDVNLILLVGGFAESPYVQESIQKTFKDKRLLVPVEADLAVLRGAVMFGHKPDIISSRVMDYTYGIRVSHNYVENQYPEESRQFINGKWIVRNVFEIFVRTDDDVPVHSPVKHSIKPTEISTRIPIYRTKDKHPRFTTDPGCELLGQLVVDHDENIALDEQELDVTFLFGDTELFVCSRDAKTGNEETLTLDLSI